MKLDRLSLWLGIVCLTTAGLISEPVSAPGAPASSSARSASAPGDPASQQVVRRLSLEEAVGEARSNNYQVLIARDRLEEARGRNLEAWRAYLPQLVVSEQFLRSTDPVAVFGTKLRQGIFTESDFDVDRLNHPDEIDNFATRVELTQPLLNLDAMFGKSAAGNAAKASEFSLLRAEEAVALETEKAYYALVLSQTHLETILDAEKSAEAHHREVEAAYDKGLVSESDLLASRVRLAEVEEQRLNARLSIANAGDHLKFLLGIDENVEVVPADDLVITESELEIADVPLDTIPAGRSDLVAFRYQDEAARRETWMRRAEWVPRLNAFGSTEWSGEEIFATRRNYWSVGFMLEWNLFDGLGTWGRAKQAAARSAAAQTQYREARARSAMEVRRSYRSLVTARERVEVAQKAVSQSSESLRIVEARFQQGLEKASELLDREAAHTNAKLRLQNAMYDFKIARSELRFHLGAPALETAPRQ
jgi:outer membrane protein